MLIIKSTVWIKNVCVNLQNAQKKGCVLFFYNLRGCVCVCMFITSKILKFKGNFSFILALVLEYKTHIPHSQSKNEICTQVKYHFKLSYLILLMLCFFPVSRHYVSIAKLSTQALIRE